MVVSITKSFHCTVVGDGLVGKSCLVERFLGGDFTNEYVATLQDDYTTKCNLNGDNLNMNITDIAGEHEDLASLDVPDVYIVCFSLVDKDSMESVLNFWVPRIRSQSKHTPIVLIGTQLDKRRAHKKCHISTEEGLSSAQSICAAAYVECSAKDNTGIDVAFYSVILASNTCSRRKSSLFKRVLGR
ncbi:ras-related C3 botulinum toxin substrate 3-like [Ostrea edulis]|uniref:ras-related C3 botulinum toxin substrate 3-like n=1 Tax=Ostrea edulis TaxID=37623 RepID=UPI0024AF024D|nr:ras-related C3 botulinum toxin substrate 3-like [Ostrea edulis]